MVVTRRKSGLKPPSAPPSRDEAVPAASPPSRPMVHPTFEPRRPRRAYFYSRAGTYHPNAPFVLPSLPSPSETTTVDADPSWGRSGPVQRRPLPTPAGGIDRELGYGKWTRKTWGEWANEYWVFYYGECSFSMLEPWESIILHLMLFFGALLLYYAVSRYLPTHVRIIAQRVRYYLSGSYSSPASVPDANAPWSVQP